MIQNLFFSHYTIFLIGLHNTALPSSLPQLSRFYFETGLFITKLNRMKLVRLILPLLLLPLVLCSCVNRQNLIINIEAPNDVHAAVYADSRYLGMTPYKLNQQTVHLDDTSKITVRFLGDTIYSDYIKQQVPQNFFSDNEKIALGAGLVAMGAGFVFIPFPFALFTPTLAILAPLMTPANTDSLDRYVDSLQTKRIHEIQETWFTTNKSYKDEIPSSTTTMDSAIAFYSNGLCYDEKDDMVWLYENDSKEIFPIPATRMNYCREFRPISKGKAVLWGIFPSAIIGAGLVLYNPIASFALTPTILGLNLGISLSAHTDKPSLEECKPFTPKEKHKWLMQYSCKATPQN